MRVSRISPLVGFEGQAWTSWTRGGFRFPVGHDTPSGPLAFRLQLPTDAAISTVSLTAQKHLKLTLYHMGHILQ